MLASPAAEHLARHLRAADRAGTTKGSTLLMLAAANNHERVVDVLLEQGAEIDQDSSGGFTRAPC